MQLLCKLQKEDLGSAETPLTLDHTLSIRNLTFAYDSKQPIFENFSLEIPAKSSIGIAGRTGRGKTTFIDLLLGLLRPQTGEILSDGMNVYDALRQWRNMTGYVSQNVFIAEGVSIAGNVALGIPEKEIDRERLREVLTLAQLQELTLSCKYR